MSLAKADAVFSRAGTAKLERPIYHPFVDDRRRSMLIWSIRTQREHGVVITVTEGPTIVAVASEASIPAQVAAMLSANAAIGRKIGI